MIYVAPLYGAMWVIYSLPLGVPTTLSSSARTHLSDNARYIAVSSLGKGFDVYDVQSGAPKCSFPHGTGEKYLLPVLFIHGGNAIVGGTTTGTVNVWDVSQSLLIQELSHEGKIGTRVLPSLHLRSSCIEKDRALALAVRLHDVETCRSWR